MFVLSPLFARGAGARPSASPLTKIKGITGSLPRENAARNPRRTATTGAAVMIAVSLVGFITIFAASANASIGAAIDQQLKTDYIVTSRAAAAAARSPASAPARAEHRRSSRRSRPSTPIRLGAVGITGSRTFVNAADPQAARSCSTSDGVAGSFAALEHQRHRGVEAQGRRNHWKLGDLVPVTFVKTGTVPLQVGYIYKDNTLAGDYFISLSTYEKNFTDQLDFLILAKLKPGVSRRRRAAARSSRCSKPYPTAKLKDNAQYKADQKKQVNQVLISSTCCCSSP